MVNQRLFELVRREEVLLFIGAGMSLYAGYPSGAQLAKVLYNSLAPNHRKLIEFTEDLSKLADDIYEIKGGSKEYMLGILKEVFQQQSTSTETHRILAKIPHFKNIITTNYDTLIEITNTNIDVIRNSTEYSLSSPHKQFLFKIHGDLTYPEEIILTKTDYEKYFSNNKDQTIFWNAIKDRLAANHILFIGYTLNDSNIKVIIDKIIQELGTSKKEMFFVAPHISAPKKSYLQRNNITTIESTGEELIKQIYEDLKFNYLPGLTESVNTTDTLIAFGRNNNIDISAKKNSNNQIIIDNLTPINKQSAKNTFQFSIPQKRTEELNNFLFGKSLTDVIIPEGDLEEFNHFLEDIRIRDKKNISKLILKKAPLLFGEVDFVFENGLEIENFYIELYAVMPDKNYFEAKIITKEFTIELRFNFYSDSEFNAQIKIEQIKKISSVNSGIRFYTLLNALISNQKFKIFKDSSLFYESGFKSKFQKDDFSASTTLNYFNDLKKIENYYNIRFSNIDLKDIDTTAVKNIIAYIEQIRFRHDFNGIEFTSTIQDESDYILENPQKELCTIISEQNIIQIPLHKQSFNVGYLHKIIMDGYVSNTGNKFFLQSKTNSMFIQFSDKKSIVKGSQAKNI